VIEIPGYKVVRTLGRGGMATVYLAIQESFEREVALKVMSPALSEDPKFTARFLHEARIVSRLVHPNIVTVYDVGVHGNQHYLSMEYVPGMDLKQKRAFLTPPQCLQVVRDVARALDYAGRKGYVHRDVKPENIMLHDDDGRAVLMDFGIACLADASSGITQTCTAVGTPHYMSPEQAKGRQVDSRSDIYSLGVVLYLLLTGRVPYDADSAVAVGIKHVQEPVPRLPANLLVLQPIMDQALAKEPKDRFQTGAEFIAAIDDITDDDVEAIHIATKHYKAQLKARRDGATRVARRTATAGAESPSEASENAFHPGDGHEMFAVAEEDRRPTVDEPASARRWPWAVAAVLILALGAGSGVLYRDQLPPEMAKVVDLAMDMSRELGTQLASALDLPPSDRVQTASLPSDAADPLPPVERMPDKNDESGSTESPAPQTGGADEGGADSSEQRLAELVEQARVLHEQLDRDPAASPRLADLYREMLAMSPGNKQAGWGLQELQDYHFRQLRESLEQRELDRAQEWFASLQASFPAETGWKQVESSDQYQLLRSRFVDLTQARRHLAEARSHVAADALSESAGANALESYRRVLQLDAGNPAALAGLEELAEHYAQLADASLSDGDPQRALQLVDRGLGIDGDHARLQQLGREARSRIDRQARITELKDKAGQALAAGNYLRPEGQSAYDFYRQWRELEPGSEQAAQGLAALEQQLIREIERHINRNEFDAARQRLAATREAFGNSERLNSLELALEGAVEQEFLSRQPRISQVLVSSQIPTSLDGTQKPTIEVDRTLHIGFSYHNFMARTSVLQAMLYDGSRSVQIAQVPVIVSRANGIKYFRIDRPVEGFASGGYIVDLLLNNDRLHSVSFKVERVSQAAREEREVSRAATLPQ
jgi:serine/threonine-protein kinase PpkA